MNQRSGFIDMTEEMLVFVYGTLRKHEANHHLLRGAHCLAQQCWTHGQLFDTGQGYPAMKCAAKDKVYGELYSINNQLLQILDHLEDYRGPFEKNLYDRIKKIIYTDTGQQEAYVYFINPDHENLLLNVIELGDWSVDRYLKSNDTFYYFAYGSCMDRERFKEAKVEHFFQNVSGRGILEGYQLRYTRRVSDGGRADIVEENGTVEGKVYEVQKDSLPYLYRREGVKCKSYRPTLVDVTINGILVKNVLTFVVVNKDKETAPPIDYANEIIRGGTGFLSDEYIEQTKNQLRQRFNLEV